VANALGSAKDARDSGHSHPAMALVTRQIFPDARSSRFMSGPGDRPQDVAAGQSGFDWLPAEAGSASA
jgi:hypothetical protein